MYVYLYVYIYIYICPHTPGTLGRQPKTAAARRSAGGPLPRLLREVLARLLSVLRKDPLEHRSHESPGCLLESPRFPFKGSYKGDIDTDTDVEVDVDIEVI